MATGATATNRVMSGDMDSMGPIDYLVVEYPGSQMSGEAMPLLVELVDRGTIRVLDLAFVKKEPGGHVHRLTDEELADDPRIDMTAFAGASSGMLSSDDIVEAGTVIEPGSTAGILIYENTWAAPFATALRRTGAQLVASGRLHVQALLAALDETEEQR